MAIDHKACPLCGGRDLRHHRQARDDGFFERNGVPWLKRPFEIVKCTRCGLTFVRDPLDPGRYKEREALDEDVSEAAPAPRPRHRFLLELLHWVRRCHGAGTLKVLEVGCGFGQLYRLARAAGFKYTAVEPSPIRAKAVEGAGLPVFNGTVEEFCEAPPETLFDLVIMDNVIEHMPFARSTLEKVTARMAPKSHLILVVPNLHDVRQWLIPGWGRRQWMPVGHVNYFTQRALRCLMARCGFSVVHPLFFPVPLGWAKGTACWGKLFAEKFLRVYPLGLYLCGAREAK